MFQKKYQFTLSKLTLNKITLAGIISSPLSKIKFITYNT